MTTSYTPEQIREARRAAQEAAYEGNPVGPDEDVWVEAFAAALGLTVEDPNLTPGLYHHDDGYPVLLYGPTFFDGEGDGYVIAEPASRWVKDHRDKLTPARVVPAEPVELTEEQVWALARELHDDSGEGVVTSREMVNAALAKYGRGATVPVGMRPDGTADPRVESGADALKALGIPEQRAWDLSDAVLRAALATDDLDVTAPAGDSVTIPHPRHTNDVLGADLDNEATTDALTMAASILRTHAQLNPITRAVGVKTLEDTAKALEGDTK